MYHQHQLVKLHQDAVANEFRHERHRQAAGGAPRSKPGPVRALIARALVLTGARVHGSTPAVIGDRVVLLDPCREKDLRLAA